MWLTRGLHRKSGAYAIECIPTGEMYVGSSKDIGPRWNRHRYKLRRGVHHSVKLQEAWDKYGEAAFTVRILLECPLENLLEVEQQHIDKLSPALNVSNLAAVSVLGEDSRRRVTEGARAYQNRPDVKVALSRRMSDRWADPAARAALAEKVSETKRAAHAKYEYEGRKWSLAELAERFGVEKSLLHWRLKRGWPIERALA